MQLRASSQVQFLIKKYFLKNGWNIRKCRQCLFDYYTKNGQNNCGSYECSSDYKFLQIPRPRRFVSIIELYERMTDFFSYSEYSHVNPRDVVRINERTLFASAAGQIFDEAIYQNEEVKIKDLFCVQPVIRLKSSRQLGVTEGMLTSFLNCATDRWMCDPQAHVNAIDTWLNFLSGQGFYAGNMTVRQKYSHNQWSSKTVDTEMLFFNFHGLEIGVGNYFEIPLSNGSQVSMSDLSFGLERIAWAINRTKSCFDAIGPLYYSLFGRILHMDTLRTLTLMASFGVRPAHHNHGSKFKHLTHRLKGSINISIKDMVEYYYGQWSEFMVLPKPLKETIDVIEAEITATANKTVGELVEFGGQVNMPCEKFLKNLINTHMRIDQLRELVVRNNLRL